MLNIEQIAAEFEWRFDCDQTDRSKPDHLLYKHRATRIEMASIEKKKLRFPRGRKPSKQLAGHSKRHMKRDAKHYTTNTNATTAKVKARKSSKKSKKVVDPVKRKMNHQWHMAKCPRLTRPWLDEADVF